MNRLIIVGNGFDLAHGLETKYSDFLKNYWQNVKHNNHKDEMVSISLTSGNVDLSECDELQKIINQINKSNLHVTRDGYGVYSELDSINVNNKLFWKLCMFNNNVTWVDIEMFYYSELKKIVKEAVSGIQKEEYYLNLVEELNHDLDKIVKIFDK